jgi:hypothetical protein
MDEKSEKREPLMSDEERAATEKEIQDAVPRLLDESERAVQALMNPDGTMSKVLATAHVQHKVVEFLAGLAEVHLSVAENAAAPEVDRKDAALIAESASEAAAAMRLSISLLLSAQDRVQPATALGKVTPFPVPGTKLPRRPA